MPQTIEALPYAEVEPMDSDRDIARSLLDVEWYVYSLAGLVERFPGTVIEDAGRDLLADLGYAPEDREEVATTIRAAGGLFDLDLLGDSDGAVALMGALREEMERSPEFAERMRPVIRETMTPERLRQMLELLDAADE